MKTITKILSTCLLCILVLGSCKKQEGPKGDTGAAGTNGTSGVSGIKPDQVFTFTTSTTSWNPVTWPYNYQEATFSIPSITAAVLSGGDVRVYKGDGTGTSWTALPYSFFTTQYSYVVKTGQVLINVTLDNASLPSNPGVQDYKVVVLPPI